MTTYKTTITSIAVHINDESPIFGESTTKVRIDAVQPQASTTLEEAASHARVCSGLAEQYKSDPVLFAALTDAAAIIRDLMRGRLQAEAADFKADAERYRWVRAEAYLCPDSVEDDKIAYTIEVPTGVGCAEHTFRGAALPSLDEAIDAQIAASREQAK